MEKERNIKISFKDAIEMYNSDNDILQKLALYAYTEEELTFGNFQIIKDKVPTTRTYLDVLNTNRMKYRVLADLDILAKHFNGDWKKTPDNVGYFIGKARYDNEISVLFHNSVRALCAGTVFFKDYKSAHKALKILGKRAEKLFD